MPLRKCVFNKIICILPICALKFYENDIAFCFCCTHHIMIKATILGTLMSTV